MKVEKYWNSFTLDGLLIYSYSARPRLYKMAPCHFCLTKFKRNDTAFYAGQKNMKKNFCKHCY